VDGLGGEIWDGALFLCQYLAKIKCQGLRVLELGAGTGLCGLVAAMLQASEVILTDEFIDLVEENVQSYVSQNPESQAQVSCQTFVWGTQLSDLYQKEPLFDIILGSEVTPMRSTHEDLAVSLEHLLRREGGGGGGSPPASKADQETSPLAGDGGGGAGSCALFTLDLCEISSLEDFESCTSLRCSCHNFIRVLGQHELNWQVVDVIDKSQIESNRKSLENMEEFVIESDLNKIETRIQHSSEGLVNLESRHINPHHDDDGRMEMSSLAQESMEPMSETSNNRLEEEHVNDDKVVDDGSTPDNYLVEQHRLAILKITAIPRQVIINDITSEMDSFSFI